MLSVWDISAPSGISLGVLPERKEINLPLPTTGNITGVSFSVISGKLPTGTYLKNNFLTGTTFEVSELTTFTFVIRASLNGQISDRTYSITVNGEDIPQWVTPAGVLRVGEPELFYVLDNSFVDYQLLAIDSDTSSNETLTFFIKPNSGSLPPGLSLLSTGRIVGYIEPVPALDVSAGTGGYDTSSYDQWYFDFGKTVTSLNNLGVPFNFNQRPQQKLNRNYQFTVTVFDGVSVIDRIFRIFVVADNFLRADNVDLTADTTQYTADNTYLRAPVWVTDSNLGVIRANNFKTIYLETKDPNPQVGPVVYSVASSNIDSSVSSLPPNLFIDPASGELYGHIPYQPAISKEYHFTIAATKYDAFNVAESTISIQVLKNVAYGNRTLPIRKLLFGEVSALINQQLKIKDNTYIVDSYTENSFSGFLTLKTPLIVNISAGTNFEKNIITPFSDNGIAVSHRQFNITVAGEVDSIIKWHTEANLGTIRANTPCTIVVSAESSVPGAVLSYTIVSGALPPGLVLTTNGYLSGQIRQFSTPDLLGLTLLDNGATTFDNSAATFDRTYQFVVRAKDQFNYSAIDKEFYLIVNTPDDRRYANIYAQPFLLKETRTRLNEIINDTSIFTPEKLYRMGDPNFGVQSSLKMLIMPGIEVTDIDKYAIALTTNSTKRRYNLGTIKKAIAKLPKTSEVLYEILYLEVFDPYELLHTTPAHQVESNSISYYPSNIKNMQHNLENITISGRLIKTEYEFLPLWMLTPQSASQSATGYISAIPIAYCKPGEGDYILTNIKYANIDWSFINYEIDRLIIEDVLGMNQPQYLVFNQNTYNI